MQVCVRAYVCVRVCGACVRAPKAEASSAGFMKHTIHRTLLFFHRQFMSMLKGAGVPSAHARTQPHKHTHTHTVMGMRKAMLTAAACICAVEGATRKARTAGGKQTHVRAHMMGAHAGYKACGA